MTDPPPTSISMNRRNSLFACLFVQMCSWDPILLNMLDIWEVLAATKGIRCPNTPLIWFLMGRLQIFQSVIVEGLKRGVSKGCLIDFVCTSACLSGHPYVILCRLSPFGLVLSVHVKDLYRLWKPVVLSFCPFVRLSVLGQLSRIETAKFSVRFEPFIGYFKT